MTTELSTNIQKTPTLYAQHLPPKQLSDHRKWISARVEALLDGYWDKAPAAAIKAEIMADWMASLQNFTPDEIRQGCRSYLSGPDCKRKPKPGDICGLIIAERRKHITPQPHPELTRDRKPEPTEKAKAKASELLASAGFTVKRMGDAA